MNMIDIQQSALHKGIVLDSGRYFTKKLLVRAIQERCGHEPCFMTDRRYSCTEQDCEWSSDCKRLVADWLR